MTKNVKIHEFHKNFKKRNFNLSSHSFKVLYFIRGMEFGKKCNILGKVPKITPARPKNTGSGYEYYCIKSTFKTEY